MNSSVAVRIARDGLLAQFGKAALNERAEGPVIERSLAQELGRGDRRGQLRDRLRGARPGAARVCAVSRSPLASRPALD